MAWTGPWTPNLSKITSTSKLNSTLQAWRPACNGKLEPLLDLQAPSSPTSRPWTSRQVMETGPNPGCMWSLQIRKSDASGMLWELHPAHMSYNPLLKTTSKWPLLLHGCSCLMYLLRLRLLQFSPGRRAVWTNTKFVAVLFLESNSNECRYKHHYLGSPSITLSKSIPTRLAKWMACSKRPAKAPHPSCILDD